MKASIKKIIKEELKSIILEKAKVSVKFRKTMETLYDIELEQQQLRKKFVSEKNPTKKEAMKKELIALHKRAKNAQLDFNKALANEPVTGLQEGSDMKKTKKINLYEHYLGDLPSSKLMKMKWNPITEEAPKPEGESEYAYDEYTKGLGPEGDEETVNEAATKWTWDELNSTFTGLGMNSRKISDIRKALKNATGK